MPAAGDADRLSKKTGTRWRASENAPGLAPRSDSAILASAILDSAPVAIFVVDVDCDRILSANRRAEDLTGYPRERLFEMGLNELVVPNEAEPGSHLLASLEAAVATALGGQHARCELTLRDALGSTRRVEAQLGLTFREGARSISFALTDAPPRRSVDQEQVETAERLRFVLESTREGFWDWDIRSGRVFFSDQWLKNLGYAPGELPAQVETWQMLVHPDEVAQVDAVLESRLDGRCPIEYAENRLQMKSGEYRWFADRGRVVVRAPDGSALRMVGTDTDITDFRLAREGKRQAEAQLALSERLASVGMMAAGVAHEINNPLAYILNNIDYASRELERCYGGAEPQGGEPGQPRPDKDVLTALNEAHEGAVRVREIVKDLRTFSRVGDEQLEWVEVREVLESAVNIARHQIVERARLLLSFVAMPKVRGNRARLGQVFLNLLVNAFEAIEPGKPELNTVSVSCREDDGYVEISVRDTGVGIPNADIHRIFDLFYTTKPVGVGTGLGLSICHNLVEALGGSIQVQSELGNGTVFRVRLPHADRDSAVPRSPAEAVDVWLTAKRMLVVDDDPLVARSVRRLLGGQQEVTLMNDGPSALAELRKSPYDIVLCDVTMPRMDGVAVLEAALSEQLEVAPRFVFMTGSLFNQEQRQRLNAMGAPCVSKPLDLIELTEAVAKVIGRRSVGRSRAERESAAR